MHSWVESFSSVRCCCHCTAPRRALCLWQCWDTGCLGVMGRARRLLLHVRHHLEDVSHFGFSYGHWLSNSHAGTCCGSDIAAQCMAVPCSHLAVCPQTQARPRALQGCGLHRAGLFLWSCTHVCTRPLQPQMTVWLAQPAVSPNHIQPGAGSALVLPPHGAAPGRGCCGVNGSLPPPR